MGKFTQYIPFLPFCRQTTTCIHAGNFQNMIHLTRCEIIDNYSIRFVVIFDVSLSVIALGDLSIIHCSNELRTNHSLPK